MEQKSLFEIVEKIKMPFRISILGGTILLLVGLVIGLIYVPQSKNIAKTESAIAQLQKKIDQAAKKKKNLAKLEKERADADAQFKEALKILPKAKEIPSLLSEITRLGNESQLVFRLFRPLAERAKNFYIEIPVAIEVSGSYHNVALFFYRVGEMERIVNILDVSMKPLGSLSTNLRTTCKAVTYRLKPPTKKKTTKKKKRKR
jgi:type IV pilus assembly protein PilO